MNKEPEPKPEPESEPKKEEKVKETIEQRMDRLEEERASEKAQVKQQQSDQQLVKHIVGAVKAVPELENWIDETTASIIGSYALARQQGKEVDLVKITKETIDKFKAKVGTKIDPKKKADDKQAVGASTASGKGSGDEPPKQLGRKSFKDGTLAEKVLGSYKSLLKGAME